MAYPQPQTPKHLVWPVSFSLAATKKIDTFFLFLRVLRCFSSPGLPPHTLCIHVRVLGHYPKWVSPFGHSWIKVCLQLPKTYRSLPRPSSASSAKASRFTITEVLTKRQATVIIATYNPLNKFNVCRSESELTYLLQHITFILALPTQPYPIYPYGTIFKSKIVQSSTCYSIRLPDSKSSWPICGETPKRNTLVSQKQVPHPLRESRTCFRMTGKFVKTLRYLSQIRAFNIFSEEIMMSAPGFNRPPKSGCLTTSSF